MEPMTGVMRDRTELDEANPARLSEVAEAGQRLDESLERLTKQAGMLEDRLGNYLRKTDEGVLAEGSPERTPVPAAAELHRAASVVSRVADQLGDLRNRFEG